MAIDFTVTTLNALDRVTTNPAILQDGAHITQFKKKEHALRNIVRFSTVPSDILNLFTIGPEPSPKDLIDAVLNHIQTNTATNHKYLKSDAENIRLTSGTNNNTPPHSVPNTLEIATSTAAKYLTPFTHAGTVQKRFHNKNPVLKVPLVPTP